MSQADTIAPRPPGARAMAVRGFCCQNVAIGCAFGGYGIAVPTMQARFGVSRAAATLGLPLMVLAMGLASPLVAVLMARIGLRRTMLLGVALSALGYLVVASASSMATVLAAFGLLIGVGAAMFGPFPASVLASNWFQPNPGRAIGFVNMPLLAMVVPITGVSVIAHGGLVALFVTLALLHVLLVPAVIGVVDRPRASPLPGTPDETAAPGDAAPIGAGTLLRQPFFWMLVIGAGTLNGIGIVASANLFALVRENGGSPVAASLTLSLTGGASVVGSLLVGVLCDRIGAARSLALLAAGLAVSWLVLSAIASAPPAMAAGLLIGMCGAGVYPAVNVLAGQLYGPASLPRAIGLFSLLTLPLTFLLPPLAGMLHDANGSYAPVAATLAAIAAAVALAFLLSARIAGGRRWRRGTGDVLA